MGEGNDAARGGAQRSSQPIVAPVAGAVVEIEVTAGSAVPAGTVMVIVESMKTHIEVLAAVSGIVREVLVAVGDSVNKGDPLVMLDPQPVSVERSSTIVATDPDDERSDLAEVRRRHEVGLDHRRPQAVERRRARGRRTARENLADLCDDGSFVEYGALAIAAQRRRRSAEDLMSATPADGVITGLASINRDRVSAAKARVAVLAYDDTVLAGTQGFFGHKKTDRMLEIARRERLPIVWFTEGGGGRPGDTDAPGVTGLDVSTFHTFASMTGLVPRIGIAAGRCFAGNAVIFGCCDVTIATRDASIGMGGPAMIEGGGLGVFEPDEIGPTAELVTAGAIDLVADDEAHATRLARQVLGYFQGVWDEGPVADQRLLRTIVPEDRRRSFDMRMLATTIADAETLIELRSGYGEGMITALARIEGRPVGILANDSRHLGGAIDSEAAEKGGRFIQLCDAFALPLLSLCDTPGFMVGPDSERQGAVRRVSRLFIAGATASVPVMTVVVRKGYGLGAQARAGGGFASNLCTIAWPTGEVGGMGLEGAVRLGFRKELDAIEDADERLARESELIAQAYERGKAINVAQHLEIDAVIDPVDTRRWIARGLASVSTSDSRLRDRRRIPDVW